MWLFPGEADMLFRGAVFVRFSSRADEVCWVAGFWGLQSESGYYQEQIAWISQAEKHPRGLSCLVIKPLISTQRKAEGISGSVPVCFAFYFSVLPSTSWLN